MYIRIYLKCTIRNSENRIKIILRHTMCTRSMKIFDAFAGVGGIRLGFESINGFENIFANDFEPKCKITYELNFDSKLECKDINVLDIDTLPTFDIFCGGFPCQPYSIAGNRNGLSDERGKVVFKIFDIIKHHKPSIIFLENVKNLLTIHDGKPFQYIIDTLQTMGYFIKYSILNTCHVTHIPQNRERLFIVGFLNEETCNAFNFDIPHVPNKPLSDFLQKEEDIPDKYYYAKGIVYDKLITDATNTTSVYQYRRYYIRENKNNVVPTLTANMGTGGHNVPIIKTSRGFRKLTPRECFNLQGFPKEYVLPNISDSHLYKQAGNSVTVEVIRLVVQRIHNALNS